MDQRRPLTLWHSKKHLADWQTQMDQGEGGMHSFGTITTSRFALNRFGDPINYRVRSAQMLAATIHLLRGTPYIYMGERTRNDRSNLHNDQ